VGRGEKRPGLRVTGTSECHERPAATGSSERAASRRDSTTDGWPANRTMTSAGVTARRRQTGRAGHRQSGCFPDSGSDGSRTTASPGPRGSAAGRTGRRGTTGTTPPAHPPPSAADRAGTRSPGAGRPSTRALAVVSPCAGQGRGLRGVLPGRPRGREERACGRRDARRASVGRSVGAVQPDRARDRVVGRRDDRGQVGAGRPSGHGRTRRTGAEPVAWSRSRAIVCFASSSESVYGARGR
jgi:hypothetical protein